MGRVKLDVPETFKFATDVYVRIDDINYGGHLGNDAILSLIHEARVRFLKEYGFTEFNIGGAGIIMVDSVIVYKSEGFYGDVLRIDISVDDISKSGCDFFYKLTNKESGKEVARAKTGIAFFDYKKRKVVEVPRKFRELFSKK
ncbi:MAG: thioesterase family protein [candidate division WOR-3 bacterium]|nr:MAG: thioesterase family protein [candidate division WOR-3 bacterium]